MLRRLSGREHRVHTAVQILSPAGSRSLVSTAEVHFAPMTDREIEWYVSTGEPHGQGGGLWHPGLCLPVYHRNPGGLLHGDGPAGARCSTGLCVIWASSGEIKPESPGLCAI